MVPGHDVLSAYQDDYLSLPRRNLHCLSASHGVEGR